MPHRLVHLNRNFKLIAKLLICFTVFQEVLIWVTKMLKEVGDDPSDDTVKKYVEKTLDSGVGVMNL